MAKGVKRYVYPKTPHAHLIPEVASTVGKRGTSSVSTGFHGRTVLPDLSTKKLFNPLHPNVRRTLPRYDLPGSISTSKVGAPKGNRTKTGKIRLRGGNAGSNRSRTR